MPHYFHYWHAIIFIFMLSCLFIMTYRYRHFFSLFQRIILKRHTLVFRHRENRRHCFSVFFHMILEILPRRHLYAITVFPYLPRRRLPLFIFISPQHMSPHGMVIRHIIYMLRLPYHYLYINIVIWRYMTYDIRLHFAFLPHIIWDNNIYTLRHGW